MSCRMGIFSTSALTSSGEGIAAARYVARNCPDVQNMTLSLHVVLDTNVFVAAGFNPRSASARLIAEVRAERLHLVWNEQTRRETETVVRHIPPLSWESFAPLFREQDRVAVDTHPEQLAYIPDPADRKFAALARATGAVLVTSDDHLLGTRGRGNVRILTPGEFWRQYGQLQ
jgi:predicted nucleic acid-binding protein